jgi:hypothetical protein
MAKSTALTNPLFDYSQVSDDAKSKLIWYEGELVGSRLKLAEQVLEHGKILHQAQQELADYSSGVFVAWLAHCGYPSSTAYNYINAWCSFGQFSSVGNLEPTAMYALAKSEGAQKKAKKLADKGVIVTHSMAKKLVEEAKGEPDPPADTPPKEPNDGVDGEDAEEEWTPEEPEARTPRNGMDDSEADYGKCPNCAGDKWEEDEDGVSCKKCHHPHGEPAGDVDDDRLTTQRQKTVKTVEALMRAFDDLHCIKARPEHDAVMVDLGCHLNIAKGWK